MKLTIPKKVGKRVYHFQVEGQNLHQVVMESQKLSFNDVATCGLCGKDNLVLVARVAQGYHYTEIKCLDCRASLTFGQRKESPDTYFLRRDQETKALDWKAYKPTEAKPVQQEPVPPPDESGDIPF